MNDPDQQSNSGSEGSGGRTRWLRFLIALGVGLGAAGILGVGLAQGSLAASVTLSGSSFKIYSGEVHGRGFVQYAQVDRTAKGSQVVGVNGFRTARVDDFCQSFVVRNVPGVGTLSSTLRSPGKDGVIAENMVADLSELNSELTFIEPEIGYDASNLAGGPPGLGGAAGSFGMQSKGIELKGLKQTTWKISAGTLRFKNVKFTVEAGSKNQCF